MDHYISEVKALEDLLVEIKFKTGEVKIYDMKPIVSQYKQAEKLKDFNIFKEVKVGESKDFIVWGDETDINCVDVHCSELWDYGKEIEKR